MTAKLDATRSNREFLLDVGRPEMGVNIDGVFGKERVHLEDHNPFNPAYQSAAVFEANRDFDMSDPKDHRKLESNDWIEKMRRENKVVDTTRTTLGLPPLERPWMRYIDRD